MSNIKNINLEFKCPVNRRSIKKDGEALTCEKCSNNVTDFTQKSNEELQSILSKSAEPVCGIFSKRQLSQNFIKYAAVGFLAGAASLSAHAQDISIPDIPTSEETEVESDEFFGTILETMPEPIGGNEKFLEAISRSFKYPEGLKEKGRVYVQFVVDTSGQLTDIEVFRGFNQLADQAALEIIKSLNYPFKPGEQRGKPVRTRMIIPIGFDPENK